MLTRFAPTPSGYLHRGNAVNALLVSWLAQQEGGRVALRIDDVDAQRLRPEYVTDIFDVLDWLGIEWQVGPRDPRDLPTSWTQARRLERYRGVVSAARAAGAPLYVCRCSRSMLTGPPSGGCPGGCRHRDHRLVPGESALRLHVPLGTVRAIDGSDVDVPATIGDVVVWRRDDLPAYHLASVVDDEDLGITHIVRGADLRESTAVQQLLADALGLGGFGAATVLHHGLLTGPEGAKLSKSQVGHSTLLVRDEATLAAVREAAQRLGEPIGISPPR